MNKESKIIHTQKKVENKLVSAISALVAVSGIILQHTLGVHFITHLMWVVKLCKSENTLLSQLADFGFGFLRLGS